MRVASTRCTPESSGHSDRVVSMRLPLKKKQYATLFSVYAPTLQAEPAEKEKFDSELRSLPKAPLQTTSCLFLATSMLEWAKTQLPGKKYLADTALETATTTGVYCWSFAWSNNLSSPTPSFNKRTVWRQPGCTLGLNTGT